MADYDENGWTVDVWHGPQDDLRILKSAAE